MKAKATKPSLESKRSGITVRIRPAIKDGVELFVADYRVKGVYKLVWHSSLADAKADGKSTQRLPLPATALRTRSVCCGYFPSQ